jgi:phospholipid transport system substrate-binding protein
MTLREIKARKNELRNDPQKLYALVEEKILPHFDFNRTSELVLGKYWKDASPEQRDRFSSAFQRKPVAGAARTNRRAGPAAV